ncbi:MAG: trehalose-phosphatase [Rhodospirillaceae bacterium]
MRSWPFDRRLPPDPTRWALFLDFDGTLVDIAATPGAVDVPPELPEILERAHRALGGALAIVSGRRIVDLDAFLFPFRATFLGEHGVDCRLADGTRLAQSPLPALPTAWQARFAALAERHEGVLVEAKSHGVTVHFRLAPDAEKDVLRLMEAMVAERPVEYTLLSARMAYELRPRGTDKGTAVARMLDMAPFAGRAPIYVGDDDTDRDAFPVVEGRDGGAALWVPDDFDGRPAMVREWIATIPGRVSSVIDA